MNPAQRATELGLILIKVAPLRTAAAGRASRRVCGPASRPGEPARRGSVGPLSQGLLVLSEPAFPSYMHGGVRYPAIEVSVL